MEGNLQRKLKHKWVWECERGGGGVWMMSQCEGVGRNRGRRNLALRSYPPVLRRPCVLSAGTLLASWVRAALSWPLTFPPSMCCALSKGTSFVSWEWVPLS